MRTTVTAAPVPGNELEQRFSHVFVNNYVDIINQKIRQTISHTRARSSAKKEPDHKPHEPDHKPPRSLTRSQKPDHKPQRSQTISHREARDHKLHSSQAIS